jgi:SAM-dependent methyltransferase
MICRNCTSRIELELIDLGSAPLSNAYLTEITMRRPEKWFPLRVAVCEKCWLVQAEVYSRSAEIFSEDYAYFSSFSSDWLEHARQLCERMTKRLRLDRTSFVVEIGSNDGYLLRNLVAAGVRVLGVEPTASTASAARLLGVPTLEKFFDMEVAEEVVTKHGTADLIVAINVFAHVPYPLEVLKGVRRLLSSDGIFSVEFPHIMTLIESCEFDTIYHEHFSYFSFTTVEQMMRDSGLVATEVEELPTHGGSLRVIAMRSDSRSAVVDTSVSALLQEELERGVRTRSYYGAFQAEAIRIKNDFLSFLIAQRNEGKTVVGYGAAAKGNTLLNLAGVKEDLLRFVVDRNPNKVGKFLPGSRIPIVEERMLSVTKPDFVVILPWNLQSEIESQLEYVRKWSGKLVVAVPELRVW